MYDALVSGKAAAVLPGWKAFRFRGPDRKKFLHGLVTADVQGLAPGASTPACLLTNKGLLQAHFWLRDAGETVEAICPAECVDNFKAGVSKLIMLTESALEEIPGDVSLARLPGGCAAPRFGEGFAFHVGKTALPPAAPEAFEALRVERAWPRYGVDVDGGTIPLEAGLEDGISFNKGCYLGQETISRIHHLGHVNKRMQLVELEGKTPLGPFRDGKLTSVSWSFSRSRWLGLATLKVSA